VSAVTKRLRRTGLLLVIMAGLALLLGLLIPSVAAAAGSTHIRVHIVGQGGGFTTHPTGGLLDAAGLVPGGSASGTVGVRSDAVGSSDLYLRLVDVSNDDNGCTVAERSVDHTCGSNQGDLAAALRFTLAVASTEHGPYIQNWTGHAAQLERGVAVTRGVASGTPRWVRVTANLPFASGNQTQTDTFGFAVRVEAQSSSGVEGIQIGGDGAVTPSSHGALSLAFTGTQLGYLVLAGVLLVLAGLVLAFGVTRTRKQTQQ